MNETDVIKSAINCRDVVRTEVPYEPIYKSRKNDAYRCPLHNERKGQAFVVYEDGWKCFGACGTGGDVFSFIQKYHSVGFSEAKRYLVEKYMSGSMPAASDNKKQQPRRQALSEPPPADWQNAAENVVTLAVDTLWSESGTRAMTYLTERRGLTPDTIEMARLGYVPGQGFNTIEGLKVPCGITIPWYGDRVLWGIKVRRATGQRYMQVSGGNVAGCLYMADWVKPGYPVVIDEGEFNALAIWQSAGIWCSPVAIGSTGNAKINRRWYAKLAISPRILIRMDEGADEAVARLQSITPACTAIQVPDEKDPNDFMLASGIHAVNNWIAGVLI